MSERQLREALSRVHEELASGTPMGAETLAVLRDVLTDVDQRLHADRDVAREGSGDDDLADTLAERVREASLELHGHHPRLTAALEEIAAVLSRMGI